MTNTESRKLEQRFHQAMLGIGQDETALLGYRPVRFLGMVASHGGLWTAKTLLRSPDLSYGFRRLWELGRLDLTMEALVIQDPWSTLFTRAELAVARGRLEDCGYSVAGN